MTSATQPAHAPDAAVTRPRGSTGAGDAALGSPAGRSPAASDDPGAVPACDAAASAGDDEESRLVAALRDRDEAAFAALLGRYQLALVNLALAYVPNRAVAEEVVQETWLAVLQGIDRFEARSSLKTWLFSILLNRARRRGQQEGRTVPFSALARRDLAADEPAVEPERFRPAGDPWAGHWAAPPRSWGDSSEERLLAGEARERIEAAIAALPPGQRSVITLRDVQGWSADEVCNVLGLTETNQRVLLHRARSKVRRAIEQYLDGA